MDKNFNDVYRTDMAVTVDEAGFKERTMIEYGREKTVFMAPEDADAAASDGAGNGDTDSTPTTPTVDLTGYLKETDADLKYTPITAPATASLEDTDTIMVKSADGFKMVSLAVLKGYLATTGA